MAKGTVLSWLKSSQQPGEGTFCLPGAEAQRPRQPGQVHRPASRHLLNAHVARIFQGDRLGGH